MQFPDQYYSRFSPGQNYDQHLFIAGRALQSAELNEIQQQAASRVKSVADALFKDGDIIRDAKIIVDSQTGSVQCQSGAIYLMGAVRGVPTGSLTIPVTGSVSIGIRLQQSVVTSLQDPDLLDPATGTRNYDQPGAERLQVNPVWVVGASGLTDYYPVYSVTDGVPDAKEPPPNLDAVTQSLARYDRDSAGGSYVVSGLRLKALSDDGATQVYSLSEGRCRVYGYPFEFATSLRLRLSAAPDLRLISNEPHLSSGTGAQRINLNRTPATNISHVAITAEKTATLTHGVVTGASDPLPDTSVLQILEVKQGGTTYVANTDYKLTSGNVDWSPAGAEPAPGSTYTVKYQYITTAAPTAVDDAGFTVTGAVSGTLVLVTYQQKLPRIDRLCISSEGRPVWLMGVASEFNPQRPNVPDDMLAIASVYQTWVTATRQVFNDGVRVVPMQQLAAVDSRIDWLAQLIAQNRLESSIHTREGGSKLGLFTDPFLDDSQRDAGAAQTAAIVRGELLLPITATVHQLSGDITASTSLNFTKAAALAQPLRTGNMAINPYMAFEPVPAVVQLTPAVDRWTEVSSSWTSPQTFRFDTSGVAAPISNEITTTRQALVGSSSSQIETLRSITVAYHITGFGPGEQLQTLTFDGLSLATGGATANGSGALTGTFLVPSGVPSGSKDVVFTGAGGSRGSATFSGQGTLERQVWQQQTTTVVFRSPPPPAPIFAQTDPLAQTFTLTSTTQVAAVDVWVVAKPTSTTRLQLRATGNGVPTGAVLAESILQPAAINVGLTTFNFDAPITLIGGAEYAVVVLCNDAAGSLAVAELGKYDSNAQKWITSQPYTVGVLLSSSNASTWTAHQDRDMAFWIQRASFTQTTRAVALGSATVSSATDLLLMSYAECPFSSTMVQYELTLPDGSVATTDDGRSVQLPAGITGAVAVAAKLTGTADYSPVLYPGTQLVAGTVGASGTYVTRAIPAGASVRLKTIFEAVVPSGAGVAVHYKPVGSGTWTTLPQTATRPVDDGFTEFTCEASGVAAASGVAFRLTLTGTSAARPRVRDLRAIVL
jgi:hypothetical protein